MSTRSSRFILDSEAKIMRPSAPHSSPKVRSCTGHNQLDSLTGKYREKNGNWYVYIMRSPDLVELVIIKLIGREV